MKTKSANETESSEEFHALTLPPENIQMPSGELPVVREGTMGGIPAYEADSIAPSLYGIPAIVGTDEEFPVTWRSEYLGISREAK